MKLLEFAMLDEKASWERREPKPGLRHNTQPKWVSHRFPIKGGKTSGAVIADTVTQSNALFRMMLAKSKKKM